MVGTFANVCATRLGRSYTSGEEEEEGSLGERGGRIKVIRYQHRADDGSDGVEVGVKFACHEMMALYGWRVDGAEVAEDDGGVWQPSVRW